MCASSRSLECFCPVNQEWTKRESNAIIFSEAEVFVWLVYEALSGSMGQQDGMRAVSLSEVSPEHRWHNGRLIVQVAFDRS